MFEVFDDGEHVTYVVSWMGYTLNGGDRDRGPVDEGFVPTVGHGRRTVLAEFKRDGSPP